ncbi:hypothetical protein Ancab_021095 [Ancistrocladus abbreviatus]
MSRFHLNPSTSNPIYSHAKGEDCNIIDLGLSLKTQPAQDYQPSHHFVVPEGYKSLIEWPNMKNPDMEYPKGNAEVGDEEAEGVQSKERWAYVKVNMDGVVVGRKICILDHLGYSSLALQLEDMFGRQSISGLQLFQAGSEFCLFYKDREGNWRSACDVPWKDFVDCVKRLRIVRKNETFLLPS